jgi:hypothetical protein
MFLTPVVLAKNVEKAKLLALKQKIAVKSVKQDV